MRDKLVADDHHEICGGTIDNKIIHIGQGQYMDSIVGGAVLNNCEILIHRASKSLILGDVTMVNCTISARKPQRNKHFNEVKFENCTFLGTYVGCRFGQLSESDTGTLTNCDFSGARVDLTDFYSGVDTDSIKFPSWPYIVLHRPYEWRKEWLEIPFPEDFAVIREVVVDLDVVKPYDAIVIDLKKHCSAYESMRSTLASNDYISF